MISSKELKALMVLAGVEQADIAKAMFCSSQMISKVFVNPDRYPIKSMQIHRLLTDWAKPHGYAIVKTAA